MSERRLARLAGRWLAELIGLIAVAAAAIAVALWLTPMQTVTVAGQNIEVGATAPTLSLSGPGEMDLFGQSLPTRQHFDGPVRPRLRLARITIDGELTSFVEGAKPKGAERLLGDRLAEGWMHYFVWETVIAGAVAVIGVGAVAGWRRLPRRTTVILLAAGLVVAEAGNLGAIMITAYSAPASLRQVHSLNDLVGSEAHLPRITPAGPPLPSVQAVVMGDSTAAGLGLRPVAGASKADRACGRSADSYAADLASVNGWQVLNLACSGATIRQGLLGAQQRGGQRLPPQLGAAERANRASVVIVSIGANDLDWAAMLRYCAAAQRCNDRATTAYFQQQLASFSEDYLTLLSRLAALPGHPRVIINQYYDPLGPVPGCLRKDGLTAAKLSTLTSRLDTLNAVLAKGAAQFGFPAPAPDFTGHRLCSAQPYVQGLHAAAPFHPTDMGQLAIALADEAVLQSQGTGGGAGRSPVTQRSVQGTPGVSGAGQHG